MTKTQKVLGADELSVLYSHLRDLDDQQGVETLIEKIRKRDGLAIRPSRFLSESESLIPTPEQLDLIARALKRWAQSSDWADGELILEEAARGVIVFRKENG